MKLACGLIEQSRKQQEVFRTLSKEPFEVYMDLLYATSPRKEPQVGNGKPEPPIEAYDQLSVKEITSRLGEFDAGEIQEIKAYEKNNKNRVTLIERFDRSLV